MVVGRKTAPICAVCERPILDRFLLNVLDRTWHIKCVQCLDCKCPLTDKCYSREGKLYCREDFFRRFGTKCAGCSQGISPNDLVRRAKNKVFHLKCFTCMICRKQLSTGEELYILDDNKFICKEDYISNRLSGNSDLDDDNELESELQGDLSDKDFSIDDDNGHDFDISNDNIMSNTSSNDISVATSGKPASLPSSPDPLQDNNSSLLKISSDSNRSSPSCDINDNSITRDDQLVNDGNDGDETIEVNGKSGGATKRRGPRTTIKAKQLDVLKAAFMATPKPTRHIREQLAQETGLTMRVIQVWFQNKRSKERRMKQLTALGARRHFFRNPRRMRAVRGEVDDADMMGPGFGYFPDNGPEFFPGYQGYGEFFPGPPDGNVNFMHPSARGTPPLTAEQPLHCNNVDGQFIPNDHMVPSSNSPEPMSLHRHDGAPFMGNGPPRSLPGPFPTLSHPHQEMTEAW